MLNIHRKIAVFESLFNQVQAFKTATLLKEIQHRCVFVNIVKFLKIFSIFPGKHLYWRVLFNKYCIVAACNLKPISLFKKWSQHWFSPDSNLKFLTTLKSIFIRKVDQISMENLIKQLFIKLRQDFCISVQFIVTTGYI